MGLKSSQRFYVDIGSMPQEVTGSCNLGIIKYPDGTDHRFVVDCGLFQGRDHDSHETRDYGGNKHTRHKEESSKIDKDSNDYKNRTLIFNPENIEFLLVTHNHIDHVGKIPLMVRKGFKGKIYLTKATSSLIGPALRDSLSALSQKAKMTGMQPIYTEADISKTLSQLVSCDFVENIEPCPGIVVNFFKNGHLPGAALILVRIRHHGYPNINILYTGDYNDKNMFFDVPEIPKWVYKLPLTVVQESTYGDMDSTEISANCFEENVLENVTRGGTAVVPVFSLGRAQEILYVLKKMQDDGKLDHNIPIYYDGKLSFTYTRMYKHDIIGIKESMEDFIPENTIFVDKTTRMEVLSSKECKIIVTTSGMGSYGPAQVYIPHFLSDPKALIQFTGYTAEGSLGARLKEASLGKPVQIAGLMVKKRARVEYTTEFSAHAKADEMLKFLAKFENLEMVIVNHGEAETKRIFAEKIAEQIHPKDVGILGEDYFFRVGPYGLMKTLGSRFE